MILVTLTAAVVGAGAYANAADLFDGSLRTDIVHTDPKDDAIDEAKRVFHHETLYLPVVDAAPMRSSQERPADLDLAFAGTVIMKSRRPDDLLRVDVDGDQGAAGRERFRKEALKDGLFVAIVDGMLLPDERIGSHFVEVDAGLSDLAAGEETVESLLVSLAAPRLAREGVPVPRRTFPDAESRLYRLLQKADEDLAHARYLALERQMVSFADACAAARAIKE